MYRLLKSRWYISFRIHGPTVLSTGGGVPTIEAYSNCDSVLLYNDAGDAVFLGRKINHGKGTHFMWENRDIRYNVLRAVGYYKGKPVTEDVLLLNGLEQAPSFENLYHEVTPVMQDVQGEKVTLIFIVLIAEEMLM